MSLRASEHPPGQSPAAALVSRLGDHVRETVRDLVGRSARAALVDFPNHDNIGDSAIWAGERALLRSLGVEVAYTCDHRGYSPDILRRRVPEGPILLHGGGNFGDLYPQFQRLREQVVRDFPERRIVQLPQSLSFGDAAGHARAGRTFAAHPGFTLLVRDHASHERFADGLASDVRLCPDAAFCLGVRDPGPPSRPILWIERRDKEYVQRADAPSIPRVDWPRRRPDQTAVRRLSQVLGIVAARAGGHGAPAATATAGIFERLAGERLRTGLDLVGSARVVVTDRLHGGILALLCERDVVLLDNSTGKLSAFHETWAADSGATAFAEDARQALALARTLTGGRA